MVKLSFTFCCLVTSFFNLSTSILTDDNCALKKNKETKTQIKVSCEDLLGFAAEYVRSKRISEIENMDTDELLK